MKKVSMGLPILLVVIVGSLTLGYFLGQSFTPFHLAMMEANNYVTKQDITNKEKAYLAIDESRKFLELAIQNVKIEEARRMIALSLADKLIEHEMWLEALKYLTIVREILPGNIFVNYKLGLTTYSLHMIEQNPDKKEEYYNQSYDYITAVLQDNPQYADALYLMGRLLYEKRQYSEALSYFQKLLDRFPDDENTLFAVARIFYDTGDYEKARKIYEKLQMILPKKSGKIDTVQKNLEQINRAMAADTAP